MNFLDLALAVGTVALLSVAPIAACLALAVALARRRDRRRKWSR